jgi:CubicO group peptidase (beta-lactamase class C family)
LPLKNLLFGLILMFSVQACESGANTGERSRSDTLRALPLFPPLSVEEKQRYHDEVETALNQSLLRSTFNGGILVAKNGEIVYEKYVGFSDLKTKDSLHQDVPMQIASTSKTLTSAAILKLMQEGKLNLHDSLQKFFPDFPYQDITVQALLTHRSGLPEYLNYIDRSPWPRTQPATNRDVLQTLIEWQPPKAYKADTRFNYCNTNYVLLALIVEVVSGQNFPDYMKDNFFTPLGMTNSFVLTPQDSMVTQSYQPNGALWTLDFSDGCYGDKNIYSTPRDLLKWDQALYAGRILQQHILDSAYIPYNNERPGVNNYGLGWRMLLIPNGKKVIFHHGRWHGFNSAFARLTDEKVTIVILGNRYNRNVYTTARKLYNIFGSYDGSTEGEE